MIKNKRLMSLLGAGALLAGMMFASTGLVAAGGPQINWEGNGAKDGVLNTSQCNGTGSYLYWVFHPGGGATVSGVTLHLGGTGTGDFPMTQAAEDNDNGAFKATTPYYTPDSNLTAWVTWTGGSLGNGNPGLVISHGCADNTTAAPTSTPTFGLETGGVTECPCDTIPGANTSGRADGAWLLVVALGMLRASIVVLTPARAKRQR
jgi:hypothetical protein